MAKGIFYNDDDKVVVLRDKRRLLAEIDEAIKKAPEKAKDYATIFEAIMHTSSYTYNIMIYGSSEAEVRERAEKRKCRDSERISVNKIERPARSVEFGIGGGCTIKVFDEKAYLSELRERVGKTPEALKRPVVSRVDKVSTAPRQTASRQETVGDLRKTNRKGWFTDGHLLVKGEIPKGGKDPTGKPADISEVLNDMAYDRTRPAEMQYYCWSSADLGRAVSRKPILPFGGVEWPCVVFRIDGRYVTYYQGKFRVLANRFPGAEYRIYPDSGILVAYEKRRPVAGLMPYRGENGDRYDKRYITQMYVPPMREEAIEAGFLKEKRMALETWKGGDAE